MESSDENGKESVRQEFLKKPEGYILQFIRFNLVEWVPAVSNVSVCKILVRGRM